MISFKKDFPFIETKSSSRVVDLIDLPFLTDMGWTDVRASLAWHYYNSVGPIKRGVDLISDEFTTIRPVLQDKVTKDYITEPQRGIPASQILQLFQNPNFDKTSSEFLKSLANSFLVPGEIYLQLNGISGLREMFYVNPADITVITGNDGYPFSYTVNNRGGSITFTRDPDYRYWSSDKTKELYQVVHFNPSYNNGSQRGNSRFSAVFHEIEEYLKTVIHNVNTLKRGARPSGVLTVEKKMDTDQKNFIKGQVKNFYQGAEHAGNVMVMDGGKTFKELSLTNKDMDFANLFKLAKSSIYENLNIPFTFFDNTKSSFNNKTEDRLSLYDFAVCPLARRMYEELTLALLRWYPGGERYRLTYIEKDIPALKSRFDKELETKRKSGIFTINELRAEYGLEGIGDEGDVLYQPATLFPVGGQPGAVEQAKLFEAFETHLQTLGYTVEEIKAMKNAVD